MAIKSSIGHQQTLFIDNLDDSAYDAIGSIKLPGSLPIVHIRTLRSSPAVAKKSILAESSSFSVFLFNLDEIDITGRVCPSFSSVHFVNKNDASSLSFQYALIDPSPLAETKKSQSNMN